MKIYCQTCKEYVLESSDKFVVGGPYNGAMFKSAAYDRYSASMFPCREDVKDGNLFCPRCLGLFIDTPGNLLTEHGVIMKGQESLDTSFSIIHADGEMKGYLKYIKPSKEKAKPVEVKLVTVEENIPQDKFVRGWRQKDAPETTREKAYRLKDSTDMTNKAIAAEIGVSAVTVGKYLHKRKK